MTDVHWNHSICAQVPVQRSDVHNANASTSEHVRETSSADEINLLLSPAHQMQIGLVTNSA